MSEIGIDSVVAIVSGGLDSTTMLWDLQAKGIPVKEILSFDYGQRHKKELKHVVSVVNATPILDFDNDGDLDASDRPKVLATGSIAPEPIALVPDGADPIILIGPETPVSDLNFGNRLPDLELPIPDQLRIQFEPVAVAKRL